MLLKEHRFRFVAGTETLLFRIEELVKGPTTWPHRFKLTLPASFHSEAKTFYGQALLRSGRKGRQFYRPQGHRFRNGSVGSLLTGAGSFSSSSSPN